MPLEAIPTAAHRMEGSWPPALEPRGYGETSWDTAECAPTPVVPAVEIPPAQRPPVSPEGLHLRPDARALGVAAAEPSTPPPNDWPELLSHSPDSADGLVEALRMRERLDRLEREHRGE